MHKLLAPLALVSVLTCGIAGCTATESATTTNSAQSATLDSNDIMFAQMMIPHHKQAVELASLAETNTTNPAILDLAARIKEAQQPEIDVMTSLLAGAGASPDMGHAMHMPGVVDDADMAVIRSAQGDRFDELFLSHMIAHHEGAIDMAEDVFATSANQSVLNLASAIIAAQTSEISEMKALLAE